MKMKKLIIIGLLLGFTMSVVGCSNDPSQPQPKKETKQSSVNLTAEQKFAVQKQAEKQRAVTACAQENSIRVLFEGNQIVFDLNAKPDELNGMNFFFDCLEPVFSHIPEETKDTVGKQCVEERKKTNPAFDHEKRTVESIKDHLIVYACFINTMLAK